MPLCIMYKLNEPFFFLASGYSCLRPKHSLGKLSGVPWAKESEVCLLESRSHWGFFNKSIINTRTLGKKLGFSFV